MSEKYDSLIFVDGKSQISEAYKIYDMLSAKDMRPLILKDHGIEITNAKYRSRTIYYYQCFSQINFYKINNDSYGLFHSLAEKKVSPEINLRLFTTYKGVSLWDLSAQYIFARLMSIFYYINLFQVILDCEKPDHFYAVGNESDLTRVFSLVCSKRSINFTITGRNTSLWSLVSGKILQGSLSFLRKMRNIYRCFCLSVVNLKKSFSLKKAYKVVFFAPIERCFLHIIPVILMYEKAERLVINCFADGAAKRMKEYGIFYMDLQGYNFFGIFDWKAIVELMRIRSILYKDKAFFSGIAYNGFEIGELMRGIFKAATLERLPEEMRRVDTVRQIIKSCKPSVIVASDNSFEVSLIAKSLGIPVVGIQTGHPSEFNCFIPFVGDAAMVEGNYWKECLSNRGVNPAMIHISGPAKFDLLYNDALRLRIGKLPEEKYEAKKTVVFATIHAEAGMKIINHERAGQVRSIFKALKNIPDTRLIIKLHPFDSDFDFYRDIAKESGLLNYTIIRDTDALRLLYNCDLLITYNSKLSYEAVLMGKNVITLSESSGFMNDGDVWDFENYGVAISVRNLEGLENHIRSALFDSKASSRLGINRGEYILEHAYKIDGRAAERVKEVVNRFI